MNVHFLKTKFILWIPETVEKTRIAAHLTRVVSNTNKYIMNHFIYSRKNISVSNLKLTNIHWEFITCNLLYSVCVGGGLTI